MNGATRTDADNRPDGGPTGDFMRDVGSSGFQDEAAGPVLAEAELPPLFRYNLADGANTTQDPSVPAGGSGEVGQFYDGNFWKGAGGPGSGVQEDNAKIIPKHFLTQSKVVRIGGRKGIMDTQPHEDKAVLVKDIKYACQDNYVPKKFNAIVEKMRSGSLEDKPVDLLLVDGELHVLDGHHRVMAAKQLEKKKLIARVYKGVNKMEKSAFWEGFIKKANMLSHGIEAAGLGILAKPSIDRLRGKPVNENSAAKHEVAGLGVLAAPSVYHLGKGLLNKVRKV